MDGDKRLERIESKIDGIKDHMAEMNTTLAKQSIILDEHVKRTNLLEAKIEPIEKHVHMVNGALKLIGGLAVLASIVEVALRVMNG